MVKQNKRKGFTLIEVVTTVFIIGLLVLLVLPNVNQVRAFAERKQQTALVQTVQTQVDLYQNENGNSPASLKDLADKEYLSEGQMVQIDKAAIVLKGDRVVAGKK
jgi:competence protein ComGC